MEDYGNSDDEHQYLDDDEVDIDDNGYGFEAPATENMARASASSMVQCSFVSGRASNSFVLWVPTNLIGKTSAVETKGLGFDLTDERIELTVVLYIYIYIFLLLILIVLE